MGEPIDKPGWWYRVALPVGFCLAVAWLVAHAFDVDLVELSMLSMGAGIVLVLGAIASVSLHATRSIATDDEQLRPRRWDEAVLAPCVLAPLAVVAPWAAVPTRLGPGLGGFATFLSWLTRYPTLGPVNHEVLLGMGALLGSCALPAFLAVYASQARVPRGEVVGTLTVLQLVAYVPVLLRLDLELFATACMLGAYPSDVVLAVGAWLTSAAGPVLRLAATLSMVAFTVRTLRAPVRTVVWETA